MLCRVDEIPDGRGRGFAVARAGERVDIFVVRDGRHVFGYVNACPHVGTPLDFKPDTFMSPDGSHIQCSTHGARFRIADGHCVAGPCAGDALQPARVVVDGEGRVVTVDAD